MAAKMDNSRRAANYVRKHPSLSLIYSLTLSLFLFVIKSATNNMEPSACDRFFKVPELILLLMTHLEPREISRFMLTNHTFHSLYIPTLYRTLTLNYTLDQSNLLHTAAAIFMLAKPRPRVAPRGR